LLEDAGFDFIVHPADIDEENFPPDLLPSELASRLADEKARAVASLFPDDVVLAADTVVAFGDVILNKPRDADHARWMLALLAGTTHVVITGVAVVQQARDVRKLARAMSAVRMKPLSQKQIDSYVTSNLWQGKAGGYGIQDESGKSDPFVTRLSGDLTNIVGLPMKLTTRMLLEVGVKAMDRDG